MALFSCIYDLLTLLCLSSKCDEEKPACQKCILREIDCSYPPLLPLVWKGGKTPCKESERRATPLLDYGNGNSDEENAPSLNLDNLDLIINWFTRTVHTVNSASNFAAIETCQTVILNQAMQHHFLLHGLLGLSALHLAETHLDPLKYTRIATAHHTQGLNLFHSILKQVNEDNYAASIAFSSITAMFALGVARPEAGKLARIEIVDDLAQVFLLAKGWHKVVQVADGLKSREGDSIFPCPDSSGSPLSYDTEAAFKRIDTLNKGRDEGVYRLAISSLKSVFEKLGDEKSDDPHIALAWAATLPEEFTRLIKDRQSLALALLGYFCVVLDRVPQVWWLRGWSKGLFGVVWTHTACNHILEWPRDRIGFSEGSI